ncbi:50S ribosomal protein L14 [Candidatus Hodgkinia cicadicola]|nr:50S ribosomal protein L14 [Candidatus Hodgkinia cicadicola]
MRNISSNYKLGGFAPNASAKRLWALDWFECKPAAGVKCVCCVKVLGASWRVNKGVGGARAAECWTQSWWETAEPFARQFGRVRFDKTLWCCLLENLSQLVVVC